MSPIVSVVIPTYNQPALLLETLHSVFAQTFNDYEVVIVNDGSTDDTLARLSPLVEQHRSRLRVVTQPNSGVGAARNRGIAEARGKFVALLDHDDLWMPDKLRVQVDYLERHPECSMAIVPLASSLAPTRPLFDRTIVGGVDGLVERPLRAAADKIALFITCSVLMFDRQRAAGLRFATVPGAIEDVPFQVGLAARGRLGIAGDQVLAIYRMHSANASAKASFFSGGLKLLRKMDKRGEFDQLADEDHRDMLAWFAFIGRAAAVTELAESHRGRALGIYLQELKHQLQDGHMKFVLGFPALALATRRVFEAWRNKGHA